MARATRLHQIIYADHPEINCIITAQAPNAMAFSVTGRVMDTKTIPESYVVLRDVPLLPYGQPYLAPAEVSARLSKRTPVLFIRNDTVLTTGASIHQAFDRLEVADFTAFSLINTLPLGELVPIGEQEIAELEGFDNLDLLCKGGDHIIAFKTFRISDVEDKNRNTNPKISKVRFNKERLVEVSEAKRF